MKYLNFQKKIIYHYSIIYKIVKNEKHFPVHATISLGNFCNHRCIWCSVYEYHKLKVTYINHLHLLDFLKKAKKKGLKAITYVGNGEPTTYPYFKELINEVYNLGIEQAMFTNGYFLDKYQDEILKYFTWVRISLDAGSEYVHEITHGVKQQFNKIINNIKTLVVGRQNILPTIGIQYAVHQINIQDLYNSAKIASDLGVDYFSIKPVFTRGAVGKKVEKNNLKFEELKPIVNRIKEDVGNNLMIFFRPHQFSSHSQEKTIFNYSRCVAGFFNLNIYEDGMITICGPNKVCVGDIYMDLEIIENNIFYKSKNLKLDLCPAGCRYHELNFLIDCIVNDKFVRENHVNFI